MDKAIELFWLGRYSERVYTTIREFFTGYDTMIDEKADSYDAFCRRINIPNVYTSKEDFLKRYPFDETLPDSIISNLSRAYDNAIINREEVGSESLAYIQMALDHMAQAGDSKAPLLELQEVIDDILAFWGCSYDSMESDVARDIIMTGRRFERLDLYLRFAMDQEQIELQCRRMLARAKNSGFRLRADKINECMAMYRLGPQYYGKAVECLEASI